MAESRSFIELEKERAEWSLSTFTEATKESSLLKALEELKEIQHNHEHGVRDPEEYADLIMCAFDSAKREGITPEEIRDAFAKKNNININERTWVMNPDKTYSHVKTEVN